MQHVICTGNIAREQFNEFCGLVGTPNNVHVVKGDFDGDADADDDSSLQFPEVRVVQVGQFRIGLIHGHQLLPSASSQDAKSRMRRKLNVDIFVSGHTHQNEVVLEDGCYHINPGSITGAYSAITPDATPSFILLAVQDTKLVCYVYEMSKEGQVEVSKTEFTKPVQAITTDGTQATGNNPALLQSLLA